MLITRRECRGADYVSTPEGNHRFGISIPETIVFSRTAARLGFFKYHSVLFHIFAGPLCSGCGAFKPLLMLLWRGVPKVSAYNATVRHSTETRIRFTVTTVRHLLPIVVGYHFLSDITPHSTPPIAFCFETPDESRRHLSFVPHNIWSDSCCPFLYLMLTASLRVNTTSLSCLLRYAIHIYSIHQSAFPLDSIHPNAIHHNVTHLNMIFPNVTHWKVINLSGICLYLIKMVQKRTIQSTCTLRH